jgi:hypothetical protein
VQPQASLAFGGLPPQLFPSPWDARVAHFGGVPGGGAQDGGWLSGAPMAQQQHAYGGPQQGMQGMRMQGMPQQHPHAHPVFPADPFAHGGHPFGVTGPGGAYGTPLYMQQGHWAAQGQQGHWEPKPWEQYGRM